MKVLTINLTASLHEELHVSGKVAAVNKHSIERLLNKVRTDINRWLLFGWAEIGITDDATGEIVAEGIWYYNAFSGQGNYEVWLNN